MAKFDFSYGHHLWIVYGNQKVFKKSSKGSTYRQIKNLTNKKLIDKQKTYRQTKNLSTNTFPVSSKTWICWKINIDTCFKTWYSNHSAAVSIISIASYWLGRDTGTGDQNTVHLNNGNIWITDFLLPGIQVPGFSYLPGIGIADKFPLFKSPFDHLKNGV